MVMRCISGPGGLHGMTTFCIRWRQHSAPGNSAETINRAIGVNPGAVADQPCQDGRESNE
jgi:hypothetical protein